MMKTTIASMALIAGLCQAQTLQDPSFEIPGAVNPFEFWSTYANASGSGDIALDGFGSAKVFGPFSGGPNASGVFQDVFPAAGIAPGEVWRASINAYQFAGDSIVGTQNEAFLAIVFLDDELRPISVDNVPNLIDLNVPFFDTTSPVDTWVPFEIEFVAPLGVEGVQINIGFTQPANEGGAVYFDVASLEKVGENAPIPFWDGGFEDQPAYGRTWDGWREFGNSIPNVIRVETAEAFEGAFVGSIFGQFNGEPLGNDSGAYQGLPASEGEAWEAVVQVQNPAGDEIGEGNFAFLSLQFLDAGGGILFDNVVEVASAATPAGEWVEWKATGTAPAGTAEARLTLVYSQAPGIDTDDDGLPNAGTEPTGAVWFDAADLRLATGGCAADFDGNGIADIFDILAFFDAFGTSTPTADIDGNGSYDIFDILGYFDLFALGC